MLSGEFAKLSIEPSKNSLSSSVGSISLSEKKDNVIGSPYLSESFILARVNNGEHLFKLRYNNFSDFVEYEKSKDQVLILDKEKNSLIEFTNGKKLFLKEFQKGKNIENGYFEKVVNGNKISVYKKQKINLIDGNKNNNGYNQISQSEYKLEKEKFFIELNEILYPIETTRDIIKFFPNQ